jgi:tetratricopeptide (TPR) repeat protein
MTSILKNFMLAGVTAIAVAAAVPALAAGESDSSSSSGAAAPKCKDGQVWDPNASTWLGKGKCVAAADLVKPEEKKPEEKKQSLIYDYGKQLAKAGEYEQAIRVLAMAPDQNDPRVLNYLGYSHRKLGKMDAALQYYQAAVEQNPDFSLVREYLGEAYIQLGLLEKAREQLTEIERICGGRSCGEYGQLAQLIVDSQSKN